MEQKYNGWANYPTWAVFTHLTNNESLYYQALECETANDLKTLVEELCDLENNLLAADLIGYTLEVVNWQEIYNALHEE